MRKPEKMIRTIDQPTRSNVTRTSLSTDIEIVPFMKSNECKRSLPFVKNSANKMHNCSRDNR